MVIRLSDRKIYFKSNPIEVIQMSNQVVNITVLSKKGEELKVGCEEMEDDVVKLVGNVVYSFIHK